MENLQTNKNHYLLLGITGGIATGKSTVSDMLEKLGARLIDLDVIAREVVEPGQPALKKIADYFGTGVLHKDGTLDRKKLSKIVFQAPEKRKVLENFTHPLIREKFLRYAKLIIKEEPNAIIQVAVPLLIETNMQSLFDKIVVVYVSPKKQIERLTQRDGISEKEAVNIINAQLSIDEKLKYADFVINNENSLEETEKQVKAMWRELGIRN